MTTTPVLGLPLIASQQAQPELTHNEMVYLIQATLFGAQGSQNAPPVSPADGDVWVVGTAGSGAWAGRNNCIAVYYNSAWVFQPGNNSAGSPIAMGAAQEGMRIWRQDLNALYIWNGSAWVDFATFGSGFVLKAGDTMTGALKVPAGLVGTPGLRVGDDDTGFFQTAAKLHVAVDGAEHLRLLNTAGPLLALGAGYDPLWGLHMRRLTGAAASAVAWIEGEGTSSASIIASHVSTDSVPAGMFQLKARGTIASPSVCATNDQVFNFTAQAHTGSAFTNVMSIGSTIVAGSPGPANMESTIFFDCCPASSATNTRLLTGRHSSGITIASVGVNVPAGSAATPSVQVGATDTGLYRPSAGVVGVSGSGVLLGSFVSSGLAIARTGGTSAAVSVTGESSTSVYVQRSSADASGPGISIVKTRGTVGSPGNNATGDLIFSLAGLGYFGGFITTFQEFSSIVAATPSASDMESDWNLSLCPAGSATATGILALRHSTGLSLLSNVIVDQNRHFRLRVYTVATLPAAGTRGRLACVSDATAPTYNAALVGGGAVSVPVFDNGAAWTSH